MSNPSTETLRARLAVQREAATRFIHAVMQDGTPVPREELLADVERISATYLEAFNALSEQDQKDLPHEWVIPQLATGYIDRRTWGGAFGMTPAGVNTGQVLDVMHEVLGIARNSAAGVGGAA